MHYDRKYFSCLIVQVRKAKGSQCITHTKQSIQSISNTHTKNRFVTLAPNRYRIEGCDIADIVHKQTGKKGPYSCFTGSFFNVISNLSIDNAYIIFLIKVFEIKHRSMDTWQQSLDIILFLKISTTIYQVRWVGWSIREIILSWKLEKVSYKLDIDFLSFVSPTKLQFFMSASQFAAPFNKQTRHE